MGSGERVQGVSASDNSEWKRRGITNDNSDAPAVRWMDKRPVPIPNTKVSNHKKMVPCWYHFFVWNGGVTNRVRWFVD